MRCFLFFVPALILAQGIRVEPFAAEERTVHLASESVRSVAVDGSGAVWVATGAGLRWSDGKWTNERADATLVAVSGADVWFASQGSLWHGSRAVAGMPRLP